MINSVALKGCAILRIWGQMLMQAIAAQSDRVQAENVPCACAGMTQAETQLILAPSIAAASKLDALEFGTLAPPGSVYEAPNIWEAGCPGSMWGQALAVVIRITKGYVFERRSSGAREPSQSDGGNIHCVCAFDL